MTPPDNAPAVAVVPYRVWTRSIGHTSLDALDWPMGRPERLASGTVADLKSTDHLVTYPRTALFFVPWFRVRAKVSVMIVEPDINHAHHHKSAYRMRHRFHRILTKNADLLARLANGRQFLFGDTQVTDIKAVDPTKTAMISLIASARRELEGHLLRHEIVDRVRAAGLDIDIMGRGYKPFENKADGFAPYRYSVVIENIRETAYFTEKIVDACLCRTIPIYWGAPDIAEYFDPDGLIICRDADQIMAAIHSVSEADYAARAAAIAHNFACALDYAALHRRAAEAVLSD